MPFRDVFYVSLVNLVSVIFIGFVIWFCLRDKDKNQIEREKMIEDKISLIVLSTLEKVREDLGLLSSSASTSSDKSSEEDEKKEEKKVIKIEGARLSTFQHHFYIDGVPYFIGDVVAPYGMAIEVGRDMVIFSDLNGGILVLGKNLPSPPSSGLNNTSPDKEG